MVKSGELSSLICREESLGHHYLVGNSCPYKEEVCIISLKCISNWFKLSSPVVRYVVYPYWVLIAEKNHEFKLDNNTSLQMWIK